MLKVGLGDLRQKRKIPIDEAVPPTDPMWDSVGVALGGPLHVRGTAESSGADVVVRARLTGEVSASCRRCLRPMRVPIDEETVFLFRHGVTDVEAQGEEAYPLADRAREVDLTDAVREHVVLAAPQYVVCDEACRGLCPLCGADLNRSACACREETVDARWAALRRLSNE